MSSSVRQYFFGALAIAVAIYYFTRKDYIEMALYGLAGLSFIVNHLSMEPRLVAYKKPLAILSWILIISTGLLFLYVIQFKYL
jgi:hypothetical protein